MARRRARCSPRSTSIRIAVFTSGRQDYGILRSTIRLLASDARFDLRVWAGGMHLDEASGRTISAIRADGVTVDREIPFLEGGSDVAGQTGRALGAVGAALGEDAPEALLLLGDRTETLAAAAAAVIHRVPVIHLHGGEETEGAIDNLCRHAITKLSHLHLVSHEEHARRVRQMGEDPAMVVVVGAPGLDNLYRDDLPGDKEIHEKLAWSGKEPLILVTMHPTTLGIASEKEVAEVGKALEGIRAKILITAPNVDEGGAAIAAFWKKWVAGRDNAVFIPSLGERLYWGVLKRASLVLGNSSSGIIEAPAAGVPVVNVGDRQKGRIRHGLVRDVGPESAKIRSAAEELIAAGTSSAGPHYLAGPAAPRIVAAIAERMPPKSFRKKFFDLKAAATGVGQARND